MCTCRQTAVWSELNCYLLREFSSVHVTARRQASRCSFDWQAVHGGLCSRVSARGRGTVVPELSVVPEQSVENRGAAQAHFERCLKKDVAVSMAGWAMAHLVSKEEQRSRLNRPREARRELAHGCRSLLTIRRSMPQQLRVGCSLSVGFLWNRTGGRMKS